MLRRCRATAMVLVALGACGNDRPARDEPAAVIAHDSGVADPWAGGAPPADPVAPCQRLPFAESLPIAEASGAAPMRVDGRDVLLVNADSGNHGAYLLIDATTGEVVESGELPLGNGASDDVEGLALADGVIWGVTSSGYMRAWKREAGGFALLHRAYSVGGSLACAPYEGNCGANLEGLCVAPVAPSPGACAGFVASKTDGHLYCLVHEGERLVADASRAIEVAEAGMLADCAFEPGGDAVWIGGNGFDGGLIARVTGWRDPATATVTALGALRVGFPEVIAVGADDIVYRLSDSSTTPSLAGRWRCDFAR